MKILIKKNLIVFCKPQEWEAVSSQLVAEYGPGIMISWKCRRELGFTVRRHRGLEEHPRDVWEVMKSEGWHHRYHYQEQIHLDFYNEAAQTWFVLKYLNNEKI